MATQFWDYNPATGPKDLFTTHGLWSNKCGGGYEQFCNKGWAINNATAVLEEMGAYDLLKEMQYTWKDISGRDADLWEHEFNKHATCMYTVNPACYKRDRKVPVCCGLLQRCGHFRKNSSHLQVARESRH